MPLLCANLVIDLSLEKLDRMLKCLAKSPTASIRYPVERFYRLWFEFDI